MFACGGKDRSPPKFKVEDLCAQAHQENVEIEFHANFESRPKPSPMLLIGWPSKSHLLLLVHLLDIIPRDVMTERNYLFSVIENYFPYRHLCFATSLSENLLITSADCVFRRSTKLIAVKFNHPPTDPSRDSRPSSDSGSSPSTNKRLSQRFPIRSVHLHRNYNFSAPANDNIALIRIENTNRKFVNKFYDRSTNRELSTDDYRRNELRSATIFENWKNLTNYILVEQRVGFIGHEDCLSRLTGEPWYANAELSKNSICTTFYSDLMDHPAGNSTSSILINWSQQRGAPLLMVTRNGARFVGILIRIDGANRKPLVFLRLSLYFDWIQKFL